MPARGPAGADLPPERGQSQVPGGEGSSRCGWKRKEGLLPARGSVGGLQCFSDGRGPVPEGNGRRVGGGAGRPPGSCCHSPGRADARGSGQVPGWRQLLAFGHRWLGVAKGKGAVKEISRLETRAPVLEPRNPGGTSLVSQPGQVGLRRNAQAGQHWAWARTGVMPCRGQIRVSQGPNHSQGRAGA